MRIGSVNENNVSKQSMQTDQEMDAVSKNIRLQIANAQKELREISSDKGISREEKMKKKQELQKQINELQNQLRMHQMELRKEKQQKKSSFQDDMFDDSSRIENGKGADRSGIEPVSLSQADMKGIISADTSVKQARIQGNVKKNLDGKARVLKSEIKADRGRGGISEKKEAELAQLQGKSEKATAAQLNTLHDAAGDLRETSNEDRKRNKKKEMVQSSEKQASY